MPFAPLVALGTIVFCFVNCLKALTNRQWSPVITQLVAWVSGIVAVILVAHTDYADSVRFGDHRLDQVNGWTLIFLGLVAASLFGVVTEVKKAVDGSDSASKPPLVVHR